MHKLSKVNLPYHPMHQCLRRLVFSIGIILSLSSPEAPAQLFFM